MTVLPELLEVAEGHRLTLRELDPGDMLDLIEAAGSAVSGPSASAWLTYAQMICSVREINAVPVQMPSSKEEIRELARRIRNDGLAALQQLYADEEHREERILESAKN